MNRKYDYIDLDLPSGNLWATCNIGAEKETDYGKYFNWDSITLESEESKVPNTEDTCELIDNTKFIFEENGIRLISRKDETKSIFLPMAGMICKGELMGEGKDCLYWTSTSIELKNAFNMWLNKIALDPNSMSVRYIEMPVRVIKRRNPVEI